jgi:hypothetical protein
MGATGSRRFAKILEAMMTVEEAHILVETSTFMTAQQIADKLKTEVKSLQPRLDDMEKRQVIRKSPQGYITPANIVAFHHGAIGWMREDLKAKVYPLWDDFFFAEWRDIIVDDFIRRKKTGAPGAHRIVPAHKALLSSLKSSRNRSWYEDMEQILQRSERLSFMMCGCRGLWRKCDSPIDVCLKVQFSTGGVHKPAAPNEFLKPPKDVTFAEALATIDECEDRGLVHIPLNTSHGDLFAIAAGTAVW